jgi:hypothetical protein
MFFQPTLRQTKASILPDYHSGGRLPQSVRVDLQGESFFMRQPVLVHPQQLLHALQELSLHSSKTACQWLGLNNLLFPSSQTFSQVLRCWRDSSAALCDEVQGLLVGFARYCVRTKRVTSSKDQLKGRRWLRAVEEELDSEDPDRKYRTKSWLAIPEPS